MKTTLEKKLVAHQRCRRWERVLRKIRQRIFDYEDESPEKYAKARRIMQKCKDRCAEQWERERRKREDDKLQRTPSAFEPGACGHRVTT